MVTSRVDRLNSLWAMFLQAVERNGPGDALVCDGFRATWDQLKEIVESFAAGLLTRGVNSGDRVILLMRNRPEFVVSIFALARIGAIAVPVGVREQATGLAYVAEHSGAVAVLHDEELTHLLPPGLLQLSFGEGEAREQLAFFSENPACASKPSGGEHDVAMIMYTSGTTGRPKGAIVTHFNLVHAGLIYADCMGLTAADRSVVAVPLSHITGIAALLCAQTTAAGALILMRQFEAAAFVHLAAAERMTHTVLVPAMYNLLLSRVDFSRYDLSAWRVGTFGGAPMPASTITRLARTLPGLRLMNGYGATETVMAVAMLPPEHVASHADCVGLVAPSCAIVVMDEDLRECGAGEPGELWISGPTVVRGYWDDPEETSRNFIGGYWRSGDLGSVDQRGFVRVHDRIKDMINRGGFKVFSAEVEGVMASHPDVLEAAVIGYPCDILGERVRAVVVPRSGVDCSALEDSLNQACAEKLADYKRPEAILFSTVPLPRNLNGKVLKTELRATLMDADSLAEINRHKSKHGDMAGAAKARAKPKPSSRASS